MSKVSIQGDQNGTGDFTIKAPNSNTDRTLTIPDSDGEFLFTDSNGDLTVDSGTFFVDSANSRVGIGRTGETPNSEIAIADLDSSGRGKFVTGVYSSNFATASSNDGVFQVYNDTTRWTVRLDANTGGVNYFMGFMINGSPVGDIMSTDGSSVSYNTSSDYRLKENIIDLNDGIGRLKSIPVHRFNFIANPDKSVDGFLAHEVQPYIPEAVSGEKDEVDKDGNPVYQGIDQAKLVPLLTAALQEAVGKIEQQQTQIDDLLARVAALETK